MSEHKKKKESDQLIFFGIVERLLVKIEKNTDKSPSSKVKIDSKKFPKIIIEKLNKHKYALFDKFILGVILFVITFFLSERLRSPIKELDYHISSISTIKNRSEIAEFSLRKSPIDNPYLYFEDISVDLEISDGLPSQVFFVLNDQWETSYTERSFHSAKFNEPNYVDNLFSLVKPISTKATANIDFLAYDAERITPIYIVIIDQNKSIHIDLILVKLTSKVKLTAVSGGYTAEPTEHFTIEKIVTDDYRFIRGNNLLSQDTTIDGYIDFDDGKKTAFYEVIDQQTFADARKQILNIIEMYY